jgi:DNA-binding IclR family transcriptional regulator
MFSENHLKILNEIATEFHDTQTVADKVGLPVTLTIHLLEELSQHGFITAMQERDYKGDLAVT